MRIKFVILITVCLFNQNIYGQNITALYSELTIAKQKKAFVQVNLGSVNLRFEKKKNNSKVGIFSKKSYPIISSNKLGANYSNGKIENIDWKFDDPYKVYISTLKDSTTMYYSAYIQQKSTNLWKYIGTINTSDTAYPKAYAFAKKGNQTNTVLNNTWISYDEQHNWKAVDTINKTKPVLRPFRNIDSAAVNDAELAKIKMKVGDAATFYNGIYYQIIKESIGTQVKLTDEVSVQYKGWNFDTEKVFDESKGDPITFPLTHLIKGWQIGIPLAKVGEKIRLYIPSNLAYGMRFLSPVITPNATLVFDIEIINIITGK